MRKNALIAAILLLAGAIPASAGKVAVVDPVVSPEVGSADGVKFVLGYEAERLFGLDLVRIPAACGDVTCAARIGRAAGVSKIVFAQAQKLGDRSLFALSSVDFERGERHATALEPFGTVDELEVAIPRAFADLRHAELGEPPERITVENVTSGDAVGERKRAAAGYFGFKMGMMYPLFGTYDWVEERDVRNGRGAIVRTEVDRKRIELSQWEFGVTAWLALNSAVAVTFDAALRGPESGPDDSQFLFDGGAVRFLSDGDVAPFVGAGLGVHPGPADDNGRNDRKRYMGPALNVNAGLFFMRTYAFSMFLRGQYGVIFDSDLDQKLSADIGMLWHRGTGTGDAHSRDARANNSSFGGYALVFALCTIASLAVGGRL